MVTLIMQTLNVTAAIIERGQEILIAQRLKGAHMGLRWEFPGGKIEPNESPEDCLKREIKEELDLDIRIWDRLMVVEHQYEELKVILHCYRCSYLGGQAKKKDCHDFRWVGADDLKNYHFAEADQPIVRYLSEQS
jgi:8-oxo-dGTP diphosphatase